MAQPIKVMRVPGQASGAPTRLMEYAYYFAVFYDTLGGTLPIVIPMLGGGTLLVLAASCVMRLRSRRSTLYPAIMFPIACAFFFMVVQLGIHNESLTEGARPFVNWILMTIISQSLCLRPGFLHRFAFVTLVIALMTLPNLQMESHGVEVERARIAETTPLANANSLAEWFGFCAVYFIVAGVETKRSVSRTVYWLIAVGCLLVVGLTVSRATLFAVGIATIIALRHVLKRGFLPLLLLVIMSGVIYASGLFQQTASYYAARGLEETGRFLVWPLVIERFLDSPLIGVGASEVGTYVPEFRGPVTPHNSILFIALASGIIPLVFFVAYWCRAAWRVLRSSTKRVVDAPFQLPLFIYASLIIQAGNGSFMYPWVIAILCSTLSAGVSTRVRRIVVKRSSVVSDPRVKIDPLSGRIHSAVIHEDAKAQSRSTS